MNTIIKNIDDVLTENYMPFSMSVIISRALPSVEDGFKPSQRKLLYMMYNMRLFNNLTKCANIVGQTMKLNPHGDQSIYQTLVRMTTDNESLLIPYINSKGNFGKHFSRDMQEAAYRYTEAGLNDVCKELFNDIDKNSIKFIDNYDNTLKEPTLLPVTFPTILCNTQSGIAVGMASNICSFPLNEVCDTTIKLLKNEENIFNNLVPDFPTGEYIIYDKNIFNKIYRTGKGTFKLRAKYKYNKQKNQIHITNIPYTTTTEAIIDKIIKLIKNNTIKEIIDLTDGTDLEGMSLIIKIKKNTDINKLMNKLYKLTTLQDTFSCNFNVLVDNKPQTLGIKAILEHWIDFRIQCLSNSIEYDINKKEKQLHVLYGLKKVLLNIDKAIEIIRHSKNEEIIIDNLMKEFNIDEIQSNEIANMKLKNINNNFILNKIQYINSLEKEIESLREIFNSKEKIKTIIISQLENIKKKYSKPRKTEIIYEDDIEEITHEDLIEDYNCKIIYTKEHYIKKLNKSAPFEQHNLKEKDIIIEEISSNNKDTLLFFTNKANRYKLNCYELDTTVPSKIGDYIPNLFELEENEEVIKIVSVEDKSKGYIVCSFENGNISKVHIKQFINNYTKMVNCYNIESRLLDIKYIEDDVDVLFISKEGKGLIINTKQINNTKTKDSKGVVGINLKSKLKNNNVIQSIIDIKLEDNITLKTRKGKEKYLLLDDVAPTGQENENRKCYDYIKKNRNTQGNFLLNTRNINDEIIEVKINKN